MRPTSSLLVRAAALAALLLAGLAACSKTQPQLSGIGEPCLGNGDCAAGFVCTASRCALPANLGGCTPGAKRCNGSDVEACAADGLGWTRSDTCATGCSGGACRPQACAPGAERCEGDAAEQCSPAGDVWALVQVCPTHCDPATGRCKAPACAPFSARCDPGGANAVWVCDAYGGGWVVTACAATETCANGVCVTGSANCRAGDLRCNGPDVQACVQAQPGVTRWILEGTCLSGCTSGACNPGGSCAGLALHAALASVPADGASSVLVYSDPIAGLDGAPLPDGQLFTVAATAGTTAVQILSADADAGTPGVQVRSAGGRVHFTARAPAGGSADVGGSFTAALVGGPSCAASAPVTFTAPASATGVLIAEDFTSPVDRNAAATSADWNTARGALVAASPLDAGAGTDGDLAVAASGTLDLSRDTPGLMPAFPVSAISGAQVTVAGAAPGLSGGDEVVLWDAQGSPSGSVNAGSFETHHVLAVSGGAVLLDGPVRGLYGAAGDQEVGSQRVVLQRVPQLASLTVPAGAALTAKAWDGQTGGLLFLRVRGAAKIQGDVQMDGRGFRGGNASFAAEDQTGYPSSGGPLAGAGGPSSGGGYGSAGSAGTGGAGGKAYGDRLLSRLHLGAGGGAGSGSGGAGGGAIVLAAGTLTLAADTGGWQGRVHADGGPSAGSGGGAGGSIWLQGTSLVLGPAGGSPGGLLAARGGSGSGSGGSGRIRVDFLGTDLDGVGAGCARAQPACAQAFAGPLSAQSDDVYGSGATKVIREVTLVAAIGAAPGPLPGAAYRASAIGTDPPDFSPPLDLGASVPFVPSPQSPQLGNRFRWRVELTPPAGQEQLLLGLQWALKVN